MTFWMTVWAVVVGVWIAGATGVLLQLLGKGLRAVGD